MPVMNFEGSSAPGLTSLQLSNVLAGNCTLRDMRACTGLRELALEESLDFWGDSAGMARLLRTLPPGVQQLRLVLVPSGTPVSPTLWPAIAALAQLTKLDVGISDGTVHVNCRPLAALSQLRALRFWQEELAAPEALAELPQQQLCVGQGSLAGLPSLPQLTRLVLCPVRCSSLRSPQAAGLLGRFPALAELTVYDEEYDSLSESYAEEQADALEEQGLVPEGGWLEVAPGVADMTYQHIL